jgi:hypothetical protein
MATIAGSIESWLIVPAIRDIRRIRRENVKLRLLELPLASAKTAEQACAMIIKLFAEEMKPNKK